MSARFFVLGDVVVDQLYFVPNLPDHGGEVAATQALVLPGGSASNVAVVLARLGQHVAFAARAGRDTLAATALERLREFNVDESWLQFDSERPTSVVAVFITPDAERTMVSAAGASRFLDAEGFSPGAMANFDAAVFSAYCFIGEKQRAYAHAVLADAKAQGKAIIIDIGTAAFYALGREQLLSECTSATHVLMNQHELALLSGESDIQAGIGVLHKMGFRNLVIKLGAAGSLVSSNGKQTTVPALAIPNVVDTTGAGDAFTAGFAYGIANGWSVAKSARFGNVTGGLNTSAFGGQSVPITEHETLSLAFEESE